MSITKELAKQVKITEAASVTEGAAGTTDVTGNTLDMSGYEGVLVTVVMGAITGSAVTSIKMQQGAASDLSDAADLVGTGQTIADDDDENTYYIDLFKPRERYVRLIVDRATQNAVVSSATYIQYGAATEAVTTSGGATVSGESHISPAEGTA